MRYLNTESTIFESKESINITYDPKWKIDQKEAFVNFKYRKLIFETEGKNRFKVEFWEIIHTSIKIDFFGPKIREYRTTSIQDFFEVFPEFSDILDPTYNCHGYSLSNKKYYINDNDASKIFDDEYEHCEINKCEIVVFISKDTKQIIHSGVFNSKRGDFSDKQGIVIFNPSITIQCIQKNYPNSIYHFLKKKKANK